MKWLEMIHWRMITPNNDALKGLRELIQGFQTGASPSISAYRHSELLTHLVVHLAWDTAAPRPGGSVLGCRLARTFAENGMADHAIWIELD